MVVVVVGWWGALLFLICLHFSAPNNSPHFTAVCSLDSMQGTRELDNFERGNAQPGSPCKEPIVSGTPYSPPVPASLERQSPVLYSALLYSDRSCQNTSGESFFIAPPEFWSRRGPQEHKA